MIAHTYYIIKDTETNRYWTGRFWEEGGFSKDDRDAKEFYSGNDVVAELQSEDENDVEYLRNRTFEVIKRISTK